MWLRDLLVGNIGFDERDLSVYKQRWCVLECPCLARFGFSDAPALSHGSILGMFWNPERWQNARQSCGNPNADPLLSLRRQTSIHPSGHQTRRTSKHRSAQEAIATAPATSNVENPVKYDGETRSHDQLHQPSPLGSVQEMSGGRQHNVNSAFVDATPLRRPLIVTST